ncbi:MAG: hypothetical protein AAB229_02925 [Candidatus Hydrogenedentota bacterium]
MMKKAAGFAAIVILVCAGGMSARAEESMENVKRVAYGQPTGEASAGSIAANDAIWPSATRTEAARPAAPVRALPVIARPAQPMKPRVSAAPPASERSIAPAQAIRRVQDLAGVTPAAARTEASSAPAPQTVAVPSSATEATVSDPTASSRTATATDPQPNLRSPHLATPSLAAISSEPIGPPQFDPISASASGAVTAEEPVSAEMNAAGDAAEEAVEPFVSRRDLLGKPKTTVVPDVAQPALAPTGLAAAAAAGYFKLAAGALFLVSLGLIGYRHKQKTKTDDFDYVGSWLPPRKDGGLGYAAAGGYGGGRRAGRSMAASATVNGRYTTDRDRAMENDLIWKEASPRSGRFAEDDHENSDPGFHDAVEQKIRRRTAEREEQFAETGTPARARRRVVLKESDQEAILDLSAKGHPLREIAKRLTLPPAEIRAVLAAAGRPAPGRVSSARGGSTFRSAGASGNIPIEIQ